ncbi:MAG TPA: signal peptidase I [Coleofasciculaceae cyanobacterium]
MPLSTAKGQYSRLSPEPWLAVNLSMFFPGIGQLYAGERVKGLGFVFIQLILIAIAFWSILSPTGNTVTGLGCIFLIIITYILNLFDAYACASKQLDVQVSEKIPRTKKDPWFAVFLSRILPGLGQLYIQKAVVGGFFLALIIIVSTLTNIFPNLFILAPIVSSVACYHAFSAFPTPHRQKQSLITIITVFIFGFGLTTTYLPRWIGQEIEPFEIPSKSMLPTLHVGDKIFVHKSNDYSPHQGDVIVFREPESAEILENETRKNKVRFFVKRVIAESGQVVRIANGIVYINNKPLQETYIAEPPAYEWGPMTVPAQSYFVMGDNRNNSFDSHVWGFLPVRYVFGRAYKVYWPPERINSLLTIR